MAQTRQKLDARKFAVNCTSGTMVYQMFDARGLLSTQPSEADIWASLQDICFVPSTDMPLFDHLVGAEEESGGNLDAQGPRCRRIDN
jgi:hypothetical protein